MIRRFGCEAFFWFLLVASVMLFVLRFSSPWAIDARSDLLLIRLACVVKLVFLGCGGYYAFRNASVFGSGNPIRPAWILLGSGLSTSFMGQAVLGRYQMLGSGATPFPSVADVFFLLSYPLFAAALVGFLRGYASAGYLMQGRGLLWALSLGVLVLCGLAGYPVLEPIFTAQAPIIEKTLNIAYPTLDFVVLAPTVMLLVVALSLRGGRVWTIWLFLAAAFIFMFAGDALFAYSEWGKKHLDPLVHATYLLSYGLLAIGVVKQNRALSS
jgi:hypothetical protein